MKCWECEIEGVDLEEHHPVPRSRGGTKTISLCSACHSKAHHRKKNVSISKLTREGLARKMATGWKAGNPNMAEVAKLGHKSNATNADAFAISIMPIIKEIMERDKIKSYNAIAIALNREGVKTARGGAWYHTSVGNILKRLS
jgi:hypothetical protein